MELFVGTKTHPGRKDSSLKRLYIQVENLAPHPFLRYGTKQVLKLNFIIFVLHYFQKDIFVEKGLSYQSM